MLQSQDYVSARVKNPLAFARPRSWRPAPDSCASVAVTPLTTARHNLCFLGGADYFHRHTFGGLYSLSLLKSPDLILLPPVLWSRQISQCLLSAIWHPCISAAVSLYSLLSTFDKDYGAR